MSMANLLVRPEAAYLITDSGYFNAEGIITALAPKTMVFEKQRMAIGAVGRMSLATVADNLREHCDCCGQHELLRELIRATKSAYDNSRLDSAEQGSRYTIAFYSEKECMPVGLSFFTNPNDGAPHQRPWTFYRTDFLVAPLVAPYPDLKLKYENEGSVLGLMPLIDQQRKYTNWADADGCQVAGAIEVTSVSKDGIECHVLHEYPDKVGSFAGDDRSKGSLEPSLIH